MNIQVASFGWNNNEAQRMEIFLIIKLVRHWQYQIAYTSMGISNAVGQLPE